MKAITLAVNGQTVSAVVEPRQHLADFLRESLGLTGTHLGCEQGVCGACTVMIDGRPSRSCITYAIACDGADVRTIEGFDDDALMGELRCSFSSHHGLQCGFCTPGMLITARDVVQRLGDVDDKIVREELSGNLCRCTGYVGIVAAVRDVAQGKQPQRDPVPEASAASTVPVMAAPAAVLVTPASTPGTIAAKPATPAPGPSPPRSANAAAWTTLEQQVDIDADPAAVWNALRDVRRVAACLPGATIDHVEGTALSGHMTIRFGPIKTRFHGDGIISLDDAGRSGSISGAGRETGGSQAMGEANYRVLRGATAGTTRLHVVLRYQLTGALAQFSRGALVQDFVRRMTEIFAANLAAALNDRAVPARTSTDLNLVTMVAGVLWRRLRNLFVR